METLIIAGRTLGFSFAAGLNLYATVAILGLATRYGWVSLPPQYAVFNNGFIITAALVLYVVEFVADKVPWLDSLWDALHSFVRPAGGALIAVATLGEASPMVQGLVALLGASVAASSHFTKAGTRVMVNASPEPVSNWVLSFSEDLLVVGLGYLALQYPLVALGVGVLLLVLIGVFAAAIVRAVKRRFQKRQGPVAAPGPI